MKIDTTLLAALLPALLTVGSRSSLLVSGMQDQVAQAIRMLRLCDLPQPENTEHVGPTANPSRLAKLEKRIAALEKKLTEKANKSGER